MAGLAHLGTEPDLDPGRDPLRGLPKWVTIVDMVSRYWIATLVSTEETST
jgi:hypothetical protein